MKITQKIEKLREKMAELGINAYIIPSTDPHISEYVPQRWTSRAWISGFTGSAGTIVVTDKIAGLFTDSRYFLQATHELEGSAIELFKVGNTGVEDYPDWIKSNLKSGDVLGFDGMVVQAALAKGIVAELKQNGVETSFGHDLVEQIWTDRPSIPDNEIFVHELQYAGKSRVEKINDIRSKMKQKNVDTHVVATLDDLCWIFNIRGKDVAFNPVAVCYGIITLQKAQLYIYDSKLTSEVRAELESDGVEICNYDDLLSSVKEFAASSRVYVDPARVNYALYTAIPTECTKIEGMNFSTNMKACKNDIEIQGVKNAMRRDAVAMCEFIHWFEKTLGKEKITEVSAGEKLRQIRSEKELFFGESFNTIAGYAGNGAIVHYGATPESDTEIKAEGFFLLDSGGQYLDGTTDITRMFCLSEPTDQMMIDYTLVLKGHINLSLAKYPINTRGSQLDVLARIEMWNRAMNYGHGTGHGVGCFMNVHEGPQNIRMNENPAVLEPGMITSNEPGLYREGQYGIRIENLVLTVPFTETEFGKFLQFVNLTLCPIDTRAIKVSMLTQDELNWFNEYHQLVYDEVSPLLDDELKNWLKEKTKSL
jgi:Xaa-Pro aminopeptidase